MWLQTINLVPIFNEYCPQWEALTDKTEEGPIIAALSAAVADKLGENFTSTVVDAVRSATTARDFNLALDRVYDEADAKRIWLEAG